MTLGAFALVGMLRKEGQESENIEDYAGLAKREPVSYTHLTLPTSDLV